MSQHLELSNYLVFRSPVSFTDLLQVVMQRLSFHVHKQYYFYNLFFKFQGQLLPFLVWSILRVGGNLNCEINDSTTVTARGGGQIQWVCKNSHISKIFFTMISELWCPYSPLPNVLIHGPRVRSANQRVKPMWTKSENVFSL